MNRFKALQSIEIASRHTRVHDRGFRGLWRPLALSRMGPDGNLVCGQGMVLGGNRDSADNQGFI